MKTQSILVAVCLAASAVAGCSAKQRIRTETALANALISDEQESQLGLQVKEELNKQGLRYVQDPAINQYVAGIMNRIIPHAKKDRGGAVDWHVHVIDDPKTVNAFATPGGHMYVYTGLLMAADNEAEVAGVLSHEAGHIAARHSARQMVHAFGLETVAGMALGKNPGLVKKIGATIVANGSLLAHSRSMELEADEFGARYASAAGYDPRGIITFFNKLAQKEGKVPLVLKWLSTHPPSAERVQRLETFIAKNNLRVGETAPERLASIKQQIQATGGSGK